MANLARRRTTQRKRSGAGPFHSQRRIESGPVASPAAAVASIERARERRRALGAVTRAVEALRRRRAA